ncbi:CDP-diacylglycerol-serine O-phosphatidyltransferase [Brettanomyces nanus]|uniref:CDP-diacylglycerol--serine O-phosphatidyltransferase n=1 Tax=Eeniella nana TaxID=13502 RepID=A0A875SB08_EENNA|nr:CDP-diacylglycerol-serine O-phosphatidyltransferase [Brettanomyces nanus]QPG77215.1 CDP-diacylglycerol-serine O-phosphatidyltransferase [Brettanomyces nanus]
MSRRHPIESAVSDSEDEREAHPPTLKRRSSSASSIFSFHQEPLPPPDQKDILAFTSDNRHLSFIRQLHMADCITMLNGFSGFYSIVSCLRYAINDDVSYITRAIVFAFLGAFFDFFDGKVARLRHKASLIGQELDSLADLISFGVAPACIAFSLGMQSTADVLTLAFCVLCGLGRLARFNVTVTNIPKDQTGKSKYFEGFPIPTTLFWVMIMFGLLLKGSYAQNLPGGLLWQGTFYEWHPFTAVFFFQGSMMISKSIHIPKL